MTDRLLLYAQLGTAAVQAVSSVVLLIITFWYVRLTRRISRASDESAEAAKISSKVSLEALAEMQEQRLSASQPLLVCQLGQHRNFNGIPESLQVSLTNVGNGPALAISTNFQLGGVEFRSVVEVGSLIGVIQAGQTEPRGGMVFSAAREQLRVMRENAGSVSGQIEVAYEDIFNRRFVVTTEAKFSRDQDLVSLGAPRVRVVKSSKSR